MFGEPRLDCLQPLDPLVGWLIEEELKKPSSFYKVGPEPIVINGATWGPYKWPYKLGMWGYNPTYGGYK